MAIVGTYDNGARLTIENLGAERTGDPNRTYHVTTAAFVKWINGGYSA